MENAAQRTFNAGQFLNEAAKNAAKLYGSTEATAVRIFGVAISGKLLIFNVIVDVTLNDEPIDQAIISQIGAGSYWSGSNFCTIYLWRTGCGYGHFGCSCSFGN